MDENTTNQAIKQIAELMNDALGSIIKLIEAHEERLNIHDAKLDLLAGIVGLLDPEQSKHAAEEALRTGMVKVDLDELSPEEAQLLRKIGVPIPDEDMPTASAEAGWGGYL